MPLPDIDDFAAVGGDIANYDPPVDPTTDLDGPLDSNARMNVAMSTRMMPRAYAVFFWNGSSMGLQEHDAVWGNDPSVAPTPTRSTTGVYVLTWPATVSDPRSDSHSLNIRRGWGQVEGAAFSAHVEKTSPNSVTVRTFNGGSAADPTSDFIVVFVL